MAYDTILVDVFNLYYRKKGDKNIELKPHEQAANCINYINNEIRKYLKSDGELYLLYDPLIKNDFGYNKKFSYTSFRREIDPGYKANRHHNGPTQDVVRMVYNYYNYRGNKIFNVMSMGLEADDFVEQIVNKYPDKKIALFTTDLDWARYLKDNYIEIIDKGFEEPFTASAYKNKFGFMPTIASITIHKALFGDSSDNIQGIVNYSKAKFLYDNIDAKAVAFKVIEKVSNNLTTLSDFMNQFKNYKVKDLVQRLDRNEEEELFMLLESSLSKENLLQMFYDNVRIIKSRCKNVDEFITWHEINENANDLIEKVVGLKKEAKKFVFGRVKVKK